MSEIKRAENLSPETRKKLSIAASKTNRLRGNETKLKIANSLRREKSHLWKGGISFEPYSLDWTRTLRRSIRERDHYTCQLCSKQQEDCAHAVHHIDYNKANCNPDNLITLCNSCHSKTSINRDYWIRIFQGRRTGYASPS